MVANKFTIMLDYLDGPKVIKGIPKSGSGSQKSQFQSNAAWEKLELLLALKMDTGHKPKNAVSL